jgi:hypothetical protein
MRGGAGESIAELTVEKASLESTAPVATIAREGTLIGRIEPP